MKSIQAVQSDGIGRWVSVCVVAILTGVFCCQLLNMEHTPMSQGEHRPDCAVQPDDEDSPGDPQTAADLVERRPS